MLVKLNSDTYVDENDIQSIRARMDARMEGGGGYLDLKTYSNKLSHSIETDGHPQAELERIVKEINDHRADGRAIFDSLRVPVQDDQEPRS